MAKQSQNQGWSVFQTHFLHSFTHTEEGQAAQICISLHLTTGDTYFFPTLGYALLPSEALKQSVKQQLTEKPVRPQRVYRKLHLQG